MSAPLSELLGHRWNWRKPPAELIERLTVGLRDGEYERLIAACSELPDPTIALTVLGLTNDPSGIAAATVIVDEPRLASFDADRAYYSRHGAVSRYLEALGPEHSLPVARNWLGDTPAREAVSAGVLQRHAEAGDVPAVRGALLRAFERRRLFALCSFIEALGRHPQLGPFQELPEVFESIEYPYARWRAAIVMAATEPAFATTYAREALWDADEGVREVAVESVDLQDDVAAARHTELVAEMTPPKQS